MNLNESLNTMSILENHSKENLKHLLECCLFILTGFKNNYGDNIIKYAVHLEAGIAMVYKLSDSSATETILTPVSASLYDDKYFEVLWGTVFARKDVFIVDTAGILINAKVLTYDFDYDVVKDTLMKADNKNKILYFEDVPADAYKCAATKFYIVPADDSRLDDVISDIVNATGNTKIVSAPEDADYSILAMPRNMMPPGDCTFTYCDTSATDTSNPYIKAILAIFKEAIESPIFPKSTLLLWTKNLAALANESKSKALLKASMELSEVIEENSAKK